MSDSNKIMVINKDVAFRGDAGFAKPEIYEPLEECGAKYAIPLPANDSLGRDIADGQKSGGEGGTSSGAVLATGSSW